MINAERLMDELKKLEHKYNVLITSTGDEIVANYQLGRLSAIKLVMEIVKQMTLKDDDKNDALSSDYTKGYSKGVNDFLAGLHANFDKDSYVESWVFTIAEEVARELKAGGKE